MAEEIVTAPISEQHKNRWIKALKVSQKEPALRDAIGFSSRMFVQANLPHSDPGNDLDVWVKRNGKAILTIQQGFAVNPKGEVIKNGYPYGSMPRLILIYLASEAVKTKTPEILFGDTMTEFMRRIGLPRDSHNIKMLKKQMHRLLSADIRFTYGTETAIVGKNASIADDYLLWWDERRTDPNQRALWPSRATLNQRFFEEILAHGFPLDLDAVAGMKKSPLALDYYGWLAYRMNTINQEQFISWVSLHEQVGSSYTKVEDFKRRSKQALHLVKLFWTKLRLDFVNGGIALKPSPMPVSPREISNGAA